MGINTNLNTAPYHDDFDETKQFIRVLFKPARAVQARELTQLQSILQNQIERFGNNIFQEGTIIEGVNPTVDKEVNFVKIKDQSGTSLDDMTAFASTDDISFFITGETSRLKAKIIAGANGFETEAPNLKTFFLKYLNTSQSGLADVKQFISGEVLTISKKASADTVESDVVTVTAVTDTATTGDPTHVGSSLAVRVSDGVIYQHGHFNYVAPQLIIASKYDITPFDISIGFNIVESVIDSSLDSSLLDNAQGFNNQNAPGADRLKLEPKLAVYNTSERPEDFFALLRVERGETVFVRGDTQFNSIKKELAKRTDDESGSYVVNGLDVTTEKDADGNFYCVVDAGKAYAFGYEINNIGKTRVKIESAETTNTKAQQSTGVDYGSFFEIAVNDNSIATTIQPFDFTQRYKLYVNASATSASNPEIGECSIRNIRAMGNGKLKVYVYGVTKYDTYKAMQIGAISLGGASVKTAVLGTTQVARANEGIAIFDTGRSGMKAVSDVKFIRRARYYRDADTNTNSVTVPASSSTGGFTSVPVTGQTFAVNSSNQYVFPSDESISNGNLVLTFGSQTNIDYVYYDEEVSGIHPDQLRLEENKWVTGAYNSNGTVWLGVANVVRLHKVLDSDNVDVTNRFVLQNNQKDGYFGVSYMQKKDGEIAPTGNLKIQLSYLRRTVVGGYISPNSYDTVTNVADYISSYTGRNGQTYNPLNCFDFRPYADGGATPSASSANPPTTDIQTNGTLQLNESQVIAVSPGTRILSSQEYYMGRIDKLAIDKSQTFVLVKGQPADNPQKVVNSSVFGLADIYIPGKDASKSAANPIRVERNTVKNYTMKDIERIEKRVDKAYDILAVSMLEQQTNDLFIPDASGNNRFKNGILVDQFRNLKIADLADSAFNASIDKGATVLTPKVHQFPVDLKVDPGSSNNITSFDDVTTLRQAAQKEELLAQEYATTFRNLASNFYKYKGNVSMFPRFDAEYDVTENPDVTINIDLESPLTDLVDNIQEFVPLTTTTQTNSQTSSAMEGNFRVTTTTDTFRTDTLQMNAFSTQQDLGSYLTDFTMKPYMNSKVIKVAVGGLRPNTRHYFYFDDVPVSVHVAPGGVYENDLTTRSIKATDVFSVGDRGDAVTSDEYGRLFAVFQLPPRTFFVGDADLIISDSDQFGSIESAGTSIAKETYRAYSFAMNTTSIGSDVRSLDFDVGSSTFTTDREVREFVPPPPPPPAPAPAPQTPIRRFFPWTRRWWFNDDPLAQTFSIQPAQAEYASFVFIDELDLWFKKKSPADRRNGVVVQLREVENGYPTAKVLQFGEKHVDWSQITTSDDASAATKVLFDNPVKLEVGKEYAIVIEPDATDPDYFIYTAKVGENSITDESVQISSDWGSGMLFTSTNNKAWQSYQNEDIKFTLYKSVFSTTGGHVDLVPNDMEFINIANATAGTSTNELFRNDEYAYALEGSTNSGTLYFSAPSNPDYVNKIVVATSDATILSFSEGDMIQISFATGSDYRHVSVITDISDNANGSGQVVTLREAPVRGTITDDSVVVDIKLAIGGKVSYFNDKQRTAIHIKESTTTATNLFSANQQLIGSISGATADVTSVFNAPVSYMQPFVMQQNTLRTSTELGLFKGPVPADADADTEIGQGIGLHSTTYLTAEQRFIPSRQNLLTEDTTGDVDRFRLRLDLNNGGYRFVTPVIDNALSTIQAYNYTIDDLESNTSKYVSKQIVLDPGVPAHGLKVLLSAFRPTGTVIDVQARFLYPNNPDNYSDWESLVNISPDMFSSSANTSDYREFEYTLTEGDTTDSSGLPFEFFDAFQIKIVLKHSGSTSGTNLFPHVYDYRAIALT